MPHFFEKFFSPLLRTAMAAEWFAANFFYIAGVLKSCAPYSVPNPLSVFYTCGGGGSSRPSHMLAIEAVDNDKEKRKQVCDTRKREYNALLEETNRIPKSNKAAINANIARLRRIENEIRTHEGVIGNHDNARSSLSMAALNKNTLNVFTSASTELKKLTKAMPVDEIDDLMDGIDQSAKGLSQVNDALAKQYSFGSDPVDEDDNDEYLASHNLLDIPDPVAPSQYAIAYVPNELPSIPTHQPMLSPQQQRQRDEEEAQLHALRSNMEYTPPVYSS
jgi:hypothetical protein